MKLAVIDADVLGRQRTGDETYVRNLLRELAPLAEEARIRLAAVTRRPDLVPDGVEPVELTTRPQELRMAFSLPRALRRLGADLVHTQYALPFRSPCPVVVTVHDLSFAHEPGLMSRKDRFVFRRVVPRAVRGAARVLTVSERTRADLVELYGVPEERVVVTPNGVDPAFHPAAQAGGEPGEYVLAVGAIQARKDQLAALDAADAVGLPLVVAGPEKDAALAEELRRRGARLAGYVETEQLADLYRGAACLVQPSRFEGFGLPVVEAMASGIPVVVVRESALEEVAGDAAVVVERDELADGIRRALAERDRLVAAGLERARAFTLARGSRADARRVPGDTRRVKVSAVVVSHGHAEELERSLPALLPQVDEVVVVANTPGSVAGVPEGVRVLENPRPLSLAANVNLGIAATSGEYVLCANPDTIPERSAVAELVAFAEEHPRAASSGRSCAGPTGRGSRPAGASRQSEERSSAARRSGASAARTRRRAHYLLDERPTEPVEADWMLGAFLLQRRTMLDELGGWDAGFRHYCEDIDLCYRAARAGWERWYVPAAVVVHDYAAVIDRGFLSRHTLWHLRGMARFVRKHPERLLAL